MTDTNILNLPLVAAAQAQKHVTVNEALSRLDAVVQLTLQSRFESTPPQFPIDGDSYLVGSNPVNAWEGHAKQIASFLNGGWIFFTPRTGWQAYVAEESLRLTYDGAFWVENLLAWSPGGAAMRAAVYEGDITLSQGTSVETGFLIPSNCTAFGVTGRVLETFSGTASGWSLGVSGSLDRYGSGLGGSAGSYVLGLSGQPLSYYQPTKLTLTAENGTFSDGKVRLAVHALMLDLPDAV